MMSRLGAAWGRLGLEEPRKIRKFVNVCHVNVSIMLVMFVTETLKIFERYQRHRFAALWHCCVCVSGTGIMCAVEHHFPNPFSGSTCLPLLLALMLFMA